MPITRRRLPVAAVIALLVVVAGLAIGAAMFQRPGAIPSPPASDPLGGPILPRECAPTALGGTTATPEQPGATSIGLPNLRIGDLPQGRYVWGEILLTIAAPCWHHPESVAAGTLLLARADVPTDTIAITISQDPIDDPCVAGAALDPTVDAIEAWLREQPDRRVGEAVVTEVAGHPARLLPMVATADGECRLARRQLDDALYRLPMVSTWTQDGAADVLLVDGPFPEGLTIIAIASADAGALAAFRPLAYDVIRSLDLLTAVP